jgi:hypothetical protein
METCPIAVAAKSAGRIAAHSSKGIRCTLVWGKNGGAIGGTGSKKIAQNSSLCNRVLGL